MTVKKEMKNLDIFNIANALLENFNSENTSNFPVKINFYLQKNINTLVEVAKSVEQSRVEIVKRYGHPKEEGSDEYIVPPEDLEDANMELQDLFNLTQEVSINMLKLDWFDNIELTANQVKAISFMIEEE